MFFEWDRVLFLDILITEITLHCINAIITIFLLIATDHQKAHNYSIVTIIIMEGLTFAILHVMCNKIL